MMTVKEYLDIYKKYPHPDAEESKDDYNKLVEYNKELCEKYPFLKMRNVWTGVEISNNDYSITMLDSMPDGWRIAFGMEMCEEIRNALLKLQEENPEGGYAENWYTTNYDSDKIIPYLEGYSLFDIKEKYGGLRWDDNGAPEEVHNIVRKYEKLSYKTCIYCGELAKYESRGWISPFCEGCAKEFYKNNYSSRASFEECFSKIEEEK